MVKEAHFLHPIHVPQDEHAATEICLQLRPIHSSNEKGAGLSEIVIFANHDGSWTECFRAQVQVQVQDEHEAAPVSQIDGGRERRIERERILSLHARADTSCTTAVDSTVFYAFLQDRGLDYGPTFRLLNDVHWDGGHVSAARINITSSSGDNQGAAHPTVLDAAMHLVLVQISKAMSGPTPTLVPQRLANAWFSTKAWSNSALEDSHSLRLVSMLKHRSNNFGYEVSISAIGHDGSPLYTFEQIAMVPVSHDNASAHVTDGDEASGGRRVLYELEWKPQLSGLDPFELQQLCSNAATAQHGDHESHLKAGHGVGGTGIEKLNSILRKVAHHAVHSPRTIDVEPLNLPDHLRQFSASLKYHYESSEEWKARAANTWENIQTLLDDIETENPDYRIFTDIGRNLKSVLEGKDTDMLEVLSSSSAINVFYASVFEHVGDVRFQAFLDLATHQNPGMRIIEVGGGTGGMTGKVLKALRQFEQQTGAARFAEYTFTDLSPAFFDSARAKFGSGLSDRFVCKKLDLEDSESEFELGAYDMVIAGSVLHATTKLASTLAHMRSLLRPGGYLTNAEITVVDSPYAHIGFGALPGWWLSTEPWRQNGPLITEQDWETLVCDAGFSGLDLTLRVPDFGFSLMVSTAIMKHERGMIDSQVQKPEVILLVDPRADQGGAQQAVAAQLLEGKQRGYHGIDMKIVYFDQLSEITPFDNALVVSLLEVGTSRLATIDEYNFHAVQVLVKKTKSLVWVTAPGIKDMSTEGVADPQYGVATGFLRAIRSEESDKHIVALSIESLGSHYDVPETVVSAYARHVTQVIRACLEPDSQPSVDVEFVVRNGYLNIGRMICASDLDEDRRERIQPRVRQEPWLPGPALKLEVATPGMLDTLMFVPDGPDGPDGDTNVDTDGDGTSILGPEEVEIGAKAWPVSFRDVFIALGRLGREDLGFDCAGVVTCVGAAVADSKFRVQPGDRVCMVAPGCMRTYPRASLEAVLVIPDSVSFHDAVAAINPGMTAYQALINTARLQKGEKVLIHSAAGSTGQVAIWIAKLIGAEIFATVGVDDKKQLLINKFGIAADHIFYSRDTSFAKGVMRVIGSVGVDVVLNSLSGEMMQATWDCIAPYGRFIEIGKMDIGANAALPMGRFAKNVSFCALDLLHISQTNLGLTRQLIQSVMSLIAEGHAASPAPLHVYPLKDVEKAFRYMQSGKNTGRIIIDIDRQEVVPRLIRKKSTWRFDPQGSYVVVGGFGGLGRVILLWMVDKGAKYLIVPSRSGASSQAALDVISKVQRKGGQVVAPRCNVGSATELAALLQDCSNDIEMPPIKGCINSALDLQDAIFEGMTHTQWERSMRSKVDSSWNLHQQLPQDMDFLILLSSLAGIYGSPAQSNYAGGCTFQDALARYRTAICVGKTSVSLDLGWMRDAGIVAEREEYRRNRTNARDMNPVDAADLIAVLEVYCDPNLVIAGQKSQLLVVMTALIGRLARALGVAAEDIDERRPLSDYGVDSLMAVELRNWVRRDFSATVAVFEIVGSGASIAAIGALVVEKTEDIRAV